MTKSVGGFVKVTQIQYQKVSIQGKGRSYRSTPTRGLVSFERLGMSEKRGPVHLALHFGRDGAGGRKGHNFSNVNPEHLFKRKRLKPMPRWATRKKENGFAGLTQA